MRPHRPTSWLPIQFFIPHAVLLILNKFNMNNMNSEQEKVGSFEEFFDERLKPDLVHAIAKRDKVFEQQKIFSDLRMNIENLEKE